MTPRVTALRSKVEELYKAKNPNRADWADWLYDNHVFQVADKAGELAERFGANVELAQAAGMLHDIADSVMKRFAPQHEAESMRMARELLAESGFNEQEIATVVGDAIRLHSCRDGQVPQTLEGKVMATADAVVHLTTDFYPHGIQEMAKSKTQEEIRQWGLPKIERDYRNKILFDDVRAETANDYERVKKLFTL